MEQNIREVNADSTTTPPQQLFRELADLGGLVFAMLTGPQVAVGCRTAYSMAFVAVEGLCREVSRATGGLSRGFMTREGVADPSRIADANACLGRIGEPNARCSRSNGNSRAPASGGPPGTRRSS